MIKLHNSMSHEVEVFIPQNENHVTMYTCGPTVYSSPHIGNARSAVVFDVLYRLLRHEYGHNAVHYARNFTDVDDKIIAAAIDRNISISDITNEAIDGYMRDMESLNVLTPNYQPKATENISNMIDMIKVLIDKNHAYVANGEILFSVPSNPHPGLVSHDENSTRHGHRVAVADHKNDPRDFVLWKPARDNEPSWESPWGNGRPGWHIECSAMIRDTLGITIDVHCGGNDLRFPHHEAECAQSHCANDAPLSRYWVHNGLLTVNGQKMSKSIGNTIYMDSLLAQYPGESVRLMLLQTHYRSPLDWTTQGMLQAHQTLNGLYRILLKHGNSDRSISPPIESFVDALKDDMNTSMALHELYSFAGTITEENACTEVPKLIRTANLIGLLTKSPEEWFRSGVDAEFVEARLADRKEARTNKDWAKADSIRNELKQLGITIEDGPTGTTWLKETAG